VLDNLAIVGAEHRAGVAEPAQIRSVQLRDEAGNHPRRQKQSPLTISERTKAEFGVEIDDRVVLGIHNYQKRANNDALFLDVG